MMTHRTKASIFFLYLRSIWFRYSGLISMAAKPKAEFFSPARWHSITADVRMGTTSTHTHTHTKTNVLKSREKKQWMDGETKFKALFQISKTNIEVWLLLSIKQHHYSYMLIIMANTKLSLFIISSKTAFLEYLSGFYVVDEAIIIKIISAKPVIRIWKWKDFKTKYPG